MASTQAASGMATISTSHPYTCNTCQVAYRNIDLQKAHMKSDWHRYNLKRRVASLPPISADVFTEKVLQARAASTAEADRAYFERTCDICQKSYYSENAYQNHVSSQKHKVKEATGGHLVAPRVDDETTSVVSSTFSLGEPIPAQRGEVDSDAEEEFNHVIEGLQNSRNSEQRPSPVKRPSNPQPSVQESHNADTTNTRASNSATPVQTVPEPTWTLESCLFCNFSSPTASLNTNHMERFHGMFVPEKKYLVDLEGLLGQLQEKIREHHQCLYCDKTKSTIFGIQTHMRDKGHCKIPYTTEEEQLEIGDYYDFRSTYSDDADASDDETAGDEPNGGAKLGARRPAKLTDAKGQEIDEGEDADGWETDSTTSSLGSADLTDVPTEGQLRNHRQTDAVFYDDYELHLPSGKSVGHRSLNRYFRQNLHNHPSAEERAERLAIEAASGNQEDATNERQVARGNTRSREMVPRGMSGMAGVSDQKKRDARKSEQRGRNLEQFNTKRNDWAYGNKLNNHKNYYYREKGGG